MGTILGDIKPGLGIDPNNLGFDQELLLLVNAVFGGLEQVGVVLPEDFIVEPKTDWPPFDSVLIGNLIKPFVMMKVKSIFDPIPNETVAKVLGSNTEALEGRIAHEVDEELNNV